MYVYVYRQIDRWMIYQLVQMMGGKDHHLGIFIINIIFSLEIFNLCRNEKYNAQIGFDLWILLNCDKLIIL